MLGIPFLAIKHSGQYLKGPVQEYFQTIHSRYPRSWDVPFQKIWVSEVGNFFCGFPHLNHREPAFLFAHF